jgi:hypothetical protein
MNIYLLLILIYFFGWTVVKISRHHIISRFLYTGTISPQSAQQWKDIGVTDTILVKVLIFQGILKVADNNKYYLDLDRKFQYEKTTSNILIGGVSVAIIVFVVVFFFILH